MKKVIVVTGSSQGIGFGLVTEFFKRNNQVVVCSRSSEKVNQAIDILSGFGKKEDVFGLEVDVTNFYSLTNLWNRTCDHFGKVDIWINNAGVTHPTLPFWNLSVEEIDQVIRTNILGTIYGTKVAAEGMLKQGFGYIYNMEGMGSNGMVVAGQSIYSTSKAAITQYTKAIINELGNSSVKVGYIRPGMVLTNMLLNENIRDYKDVERFKRILNILADRVETVTPYLVEKILSNKKHGARINWLTTRKVLWRFLISLFYKRELLH